MLKKMIIGLTMLLSSTSAFALVSCDRWDELDLEQKSNLHVMYFLGDVHNLGYTLAAIALSESNAGKWRLNYRSNDFGILQINIETASNILSISNRYKLFDLAERLLYDDVLSSDLAIDVLHHFQKDRKMSPLVYKEMIMSYNRGNKWRTNKHERKVAETYYTRVQTNIKMLQACSDIAASS